MMTEQSPSDSTIKLLCRLLSRSTAQSDLVNDLSELDHQAWEDLALTARTQGVGLLVFDRLNKLKSELNIPPAVFDPLHQAHYRAVAQTIMMLHEAGRILSALKQQGLEVIGLKGLYLVDHVYKNAGMRNFGDLDLMLPKGQINQAVLVLQHLGYHLDTFFDPTALNKDIKHVPPMTGPGGVTVELHWTLLEENEPFTIDTESIWQRAIPASIAGVDVLALCPEDLLLHLCLHFVYQHRLKLGLRGLMDIFDSLRCFADILNWQRLIGISQSWGSQRVTWLALSLAVDLLEAEIPPQVLLQLQDPEATSQISSTAKEHFLVSREANAVMTPDLAAFSSARGLFKKATILIKRVFIPRTSLARVYGVKPNSLRIIPCYFKRAVDLWKEYRSSLQKIIIMDEFSQANTAQEVALGWLIHWLGKGQKS